MKVSLEVVSHIALLARLDFSAEELEALRQQMEELLSHFARIAELKTEEIPPTSGVLALTNVIREDIVGPSLSQEEALSNAPAREKGFFRAPAILEEL